MNERDAVHPLVGEPHTAHQLARNVGPRELEGIVAILHRGLERGHYEVCGYEDGWPLYAITETGLQHILKPREDRAS